MTEEQNKLPTIAYSYSLERTVDGEKEVLAGVASRNPENFDYDDEEFIDALVRLSDVEQLIQNKIEKFENAKEALENSNRHYDLSVPKAEKLIYEFKDLLEEVQKQE